MPCDGILTAGKVVNLEAAPAAAVKLDDIKASLEQHKPAALFLCQVSHRNIWTTIHSRGSIAADGLDQARLQTFHHRGFLVGLRFGYYHCYCMQVESSTEVL